MVVDNEDGGQAFAPTCATGKVATTRPPSGVGPAVSEPSQSAARFAMLSVPNPAGQLTLDDVPLSVISSARLPRRKWFNPSPIVGLRWGQGRRPRQVKKDVFLR